ncbi:MAG: hypothetical protein KDA87_23430 [Planctomycetales bacterium]|nr:hypothetical protein [Planctomycetales bacterium]
MQCIDEPTVDDVWDQINELAPEEAYQQMMEFGTQQTELLSFVTVACEGLSDDAQELATFMAFVVYRIFYTSYSESFPDISPEQIMERFDRNQAMLSELENRSDEEFEEVAELESSHQPFVLQSITEVLFDSDEEDEIQITDDESGIIFIVMKTLVDVLDAVTD